MSPIACLLLAPVAYFVCTSLKNLYKWWKLRQYFHRIPGYKDYHYLLGNLPSFTRDEDDKRVLFYESAMKFPRFSRIWFGPIFPVISVHHPETIALVLKAKTSKQPKNSFYSWGLQMLRPYIGDGLVLANGKKWKRSRKLMHKYFNRSVLRMSLPVFNETSETLLGQVEKFAESGEVFEFTVLSKMCTLDALLQLAFSMKSNCQLVSVPYIDATREIIRLIWKRMENVFHGINWLYNSTADGKKFAKACDYVHTVTEDVIRKKMEALKENPDLSKKEFLDLTDILLTAKDESGQGLTFREVRDEVDTMFAAGHETTASSISWMVYCLAKNPDCQARAQAEVDSVLAGRGTDDIEWSDVANLEYLGQCMNETMRLFPSIPLVGKHLEEDVTIDGWTIPKGTLMSVHILQCGINPHVWEDPLEFRPERFSPENKDKIPSLAFLPFSSGERSCIGSQVAVVQAKIAIARLLRRITFKLDPTHPVKVYPQIVMAAPNGIKMYAEKRLYGRES